MAYVMYYGSICKTIAFTYVELVCMRSSLHTYCTVYILYTNNMHHLKPYKIAEHIILRKRKKQLNAPLKAPSSIT